MPISGSTIYCCKQCVNGVVKKGMSINPCKVPFYSCSNPTDPCAAESAGDGGDGDGDLQRCLDNCMTKPYEDQQACRDQCGGTTGGHECQSDTDCPYGQECRVVNGLRKCLNIGAGCSTDADCGTGKKCVDGKCVAVGTDGAGCGKGKVKSGAYPNGRDWTGCPCSAAYFPNTPGVCQDGYVPVGSGEDARCECVKYQNEVGTEGTEGAQGGTFEFSPEVKALMARLMQRANWLLDNPGGMTAEERAMIRNRAFEGIKGAERGVLTSTRGTLGRMGLLGSGVQLGEEARVRRGTTQALAGTERDIAIEEAARKYQDLLGTTGLASSLTGQGSMADQIVEALNAARRGESRDWTQMLLNYYAAILSANNQAWSPYYSALMTRYNTRA